MLSSPKHHIFLSWTLISCLWLLSLWLLNYGGLHRDTRKLLLSWSPHYSLIKNILETGSHEPSSFSLWELLVNCLIKFGNPINLCGSWEHWEMEGNMWGLFVLSCDCFNESSHLHKSCVWNCAHFVPSLIFAPFLARGNLFARENKHVWCSKSTGSTTLSWSC